MWLLAGKDSALGDLVDQRAQAEVFLPQRFEDSLDLLAVGELDIGAGRIRPSSCE